VYVWSAESRIHSMDAMVVGRRRKSESSSPYAGDDCGPTPAKPRVLCVPNDGSLLQARLI
jgi:hypothetical protein